MECSVSKCKATHAQKKKGLAYPVTCLKLAVPWATHEKYSDSSWKTKSTWESNQNIRKYYRKNGEESRCHST